MAESLPDLSDETYGTKGYGLWHQLRRNIALPLLAAAFVVMLGIVAMMGSHTTSDPPSVPWTEVVKYQFAYMETVTIYCDKDQNRWVLYHRQNSGSLQEIPLGCK